MTDLVDLLREGSKQPAGDAIDPYAVLGEGRRRVRRRRLLVTVGAAAMTLLVVGTASLGDWWPSGQGPNPVIDEAGRFTKVEVSRSEAISRCHTELRNAGDDRPFVLLDAVTARDGTIVAQPRPPWYEGTQLYFNLKNAHLVDDPLARVCTVPQERMIAVSGTVPEQVATAGDGVAFRDQCGEYAGIDLTGWEFAASASSQLGSIALFQARNGYTLRCRSPGGSSAQEGFSISLGSLHDADVRGPPLPDYLGDRTVSVNCEPPVVGRGQNGFCFGAGEAYEDAEVGSLTVSLPDGRTEQVSTSHGYYAFMFDVSSSVTWEEYLDVSITSVSPDGSELATYPVEPLPERAGNATAE